MITVTVYDEAGNVIASQGFTDEKTAGLAVLEASMLCLRVEVSR